MEAPERRQLLDEILDGKVDIADLSMDQLKGFKVDFDVDYQPSFRFFQTINSEIDRRSEPVSKRLVRVNSDFFKVK